MSHYTDGQEANANLIAAAPEMYEALVSVCHDCDLCSGNPEDAPSYPVALALAKARGESEVKKNDA